MQTFILAAKTNPAIPALLCLLLLVFAAAIIIACVAKYNKAQLKRQRAEALADEQRFRAWSEQLHATPPIKRSVELRQAQPPTPKPSLHVVPQPAIEQKCIDPTTALNIEMLRRDIKRMTDGGAPITASTEPSSSTDKVPTPFSPDTLQTAVPANGKLEQNSIVDVRPQHREPKPPAIKSTSKVRVRKPVTKPAAPKRTKADDVSE